MAQPCRPLHFQSHESSSAPPAHFSHAPHEQTCKPSTSRANRQRCPTMRCQRTRTRLRGGWSVNDVTSLSASLTDRPACHPRPRMADGAAPKTTYAASEVRHFRPFPARAVAPQPPRDPRSSSAKQRPPTQVSAQPHQEHGFERGRGQGFDFRGRVASHPRRRAAPNFRS